MIATIEYHLPISYYSNGETDPVARVDVPVLIGTMIQEMLNSGQCGEDGLSSIQLIAMAGTNPAIKKFCLKLFERGYEMLIDDCCKEVPEDEISEEYFEEDYQCRRFRIRRCDCYDDEAPTFEDYCNEYRAWIYLPGHTQEFMAERTGLDIEACLEEAIYFHIKAIDPLDNYRKPRHTWKIAEVFEKMKDKLMVEPS